MRTSHTRVTAFTVLMILAVCAARGVCAAELVLVEQGRPLATIITAAAPSVNARAGALELQTYIEKMTGAKLPVATDAVTASGRLVLVGRSALTDKIPDLKIPSGRTKNLREEGFTMRTHEDRLVLAGNDEEPYFGTRYAVAEFLHTLGVRWFMPGQQGEVVPKLSTIRVTPMDTTQRPDFPMRNFWEPAPEKMDAECREWKIRNKMNPDMQNWFGVPGDGSITDLMPKDKFKEHPEWFALQRDGKRDISHPCTTSEEMIAHVAAAAREHVRKGRRAIGFAPVDGNPRCWCERCARLGNCFDGYGSNDRDPVAEYSISNEWFYFANRILTEVNREFPDYLMATNGYANRDVPPEVPPDVDFNPRKNLVVMFANICGCTIHAYDDPRCWQMKRQGQMLREWCRLSDKVWIYNYNYTMCVNKGTLTPMVHRLRRNIPLLKQWGILGFFDQDETNWAMSGLPTRLIRARLEWNTRADVDAILDDFFTNWFGPAAEPMKAYYQALETAFEQAPQHGHEDVILPSIYTEPLMARLDSLIKSAEAGVSSEAEKYHMQIERAIYDNLCTYVAMEKAKRAGDLTGAIAKLERMIALRDKLNGLNAFMGKHPYPVYNIAWEKKRLESLADKINGKEGELVALLPERARFRTDPFDDGRYERWQDPGAGISDWKELSVTASWDTQGLHDAQGHPYRGVAWYQFDVKLPETARGKAVFLQGMGVVNEAWVWVNGRYAGRRPYIMPWFRPHHLELDVSRLIKPGESNRIAVRVLCNFDVWGANGIYERMFLYARKSAASPQAVR